MLLGASLGVLVDRAFRPTPAQSPVPVAITKPQPVRQLPALARPPASRNHPPTPEVEPPAAPLTAEEFTAAFTAALRAGYSEQRAEKAEEFDC